MLPNSTLKELLYIEMLQKTVEKPSNAHMALLKRFDTFTTSITLEQKSAEELDALSAKIRKDAQKASMDENISSELQHQAAKALEPDASLDNLIAFAKHYYINHLDALPSKV